MNWALTDIPRVDASLKLPKKVDHQLRAAHTESSKNQSQVKQKKPISPKTSRQRMEQRTLETGAIKSISVVPAQKSEQPTNRNNQTYAAEQTVIPGREEPRPESNDVIALLKKNKVTFIDKRNTNGALWIIGGHELDPIIKQCKVLGINFRYKEDGGKQTGYRSGWWAK